MSYDATATFCYGFLISQEALEQAFNLVEGEGNWEDIESLVEGSGLELAIMGNMVMGHEALAVSALIINCGEGAMALKPEQLEVPAEKQQALERFVKTYGLKDIGFGWILGATYG